MWRWSLWRGQKQGLSGLSKLMGGHLGFSRICVFCSGLCLTAFTLSALGAKRADFMPETPLSRTAELRTAGRTLRWLWRDCWDWLFLLPPLVGGVADLICSAHTYGVSSCGGFLFCQIHDPLPQYLLTFRRLIQPMYCSERMYRTDLPMKRRPRIYSMCQLPGWFC